MSISIILIILVSSYYHFVYKYFTLCVSINQTELDSNVTASFKKQFHKKFQNFVDENSTIVTGLCSPVRQNILDTYAAKQLS